MSGSGPWGSRRSKSQNKADTAINSTQRLNRKVKFPICSDNIACWKHKTWVVPPQNNYQGKMFHLNCLAGGIVRLFHYFTKFIVLPY